LTLLLLPQYNELSLTELLLIMNKRDIDKHNTRKLILDETKALIIKAQETSISTAFIAKSCNLAHGTLFIHFPTKNELIYELFHQELKRIANKLYLIVNTSPQVSLEVLLDKYFLFLEKEEKFLSIIAKELPLYPEKLKRDIMTTEIIIRNFFYSTIEKGIEKNIYQTIDITTTLTFLFGTIDYYLRMKSYFVSKGSVIAQKKDDIKKCFVAFLTQRGEEDMKEIICESCGMPMRKKEDFGGGKLDNKYCVHCTYKDGSLMSYTDKLNAMAKFIISRMGMDKEMAIETAKETMAKMPAWKKYN